MIGIVSLILWALTVMVSLKYVIFVLRADNDGEGGILALLSLVAADQVANGAKLPALVLLGVVGASLLYGDGVITPAISVLSAMEGLKLVAPAFEHFIVPATIAVLIGLFVIQRYGTGSIGKLFGPIMVVWFVVHRRAWRWPISGWRPRSCGRSIRSRPRTSWSPIPRSPLS